MALPELMDDAQPQSQHEVFDGNQLSLEFLTVLKNFLKTRYRSSNGSIGSINGGAQKTIAHELGVTPTIVSIEGYTNDHPIFLYQASDATNIYIQNGASTGFGGGYWFAAYIQN